ECWLYTPDVIGSSPVPPTTVERHSSIPFPAIAAHRMQNDFAVADFAEAWLAKFPRIEERGLGPRLLAALAGMSGGPNAVDDLDDIEVIAAALLELVAMLKASPGGLATHFPTLFGSALKGKAGLS
ncbi:MAG TPA: hypothetical protein VER04_11285, partial [Polyangiaceae bacterium]|nr:hypothetical protein [Polyangiaceae bacterium]